MAAMTMAARAGCGRSRNSGVSATSVRMQRTAAIRLATCVRAPELMATEVFDRLPGEEAYRDDRLHPEAETFPGLLIWNPGGDLFFAGVGQFERALKAAIAQSRTPVREVLIDASSIAFIDSSAGDAVLKLVGQLRARGITVAFARMRDPIRAALARAGLVEAVGAGAFYDRLTQGVRAFTGAAAEAPRRGPQA